MSELGLGLGLAWTLLQLSMVGEQPRWLPPGSVVLGALSLLAAFSPRAHRPLTAPNARWRWHDRVRWQCPKRT